MALDFLKIDYGTLFQANFTVSDNLDNIWVQINERINVFDIETLVYNAYKKMQKSKLKRQKMHVNLEIYLTC